MYQRQSWRGRSVDLGELARTPRPGVHSRDDGKSMRQACLILTACYCAMLLIMLHWELALLCLPTEPLRAFVWHVFFVVR